jgi:hypothetical protein
MNVDIRPASGGLHEVTVGGQVVFTGSYADCCKEAAKHASRLASGKCEKDAEERRLKNRDGSDRAVRRIFGYH